MWSRLDRAHAFIYVSSQYPFALLGHFAPSREGVCLCRWKMADANCQRVSWNIIQQHAPLLAARSCDINAAGSCSSNNLFKRIDAIMMSSSSMRSKGTQK